MNPSAAGVRTETASLTRIFTCVALVAAVLFLAAALLWADTPAGQLAPAGIRDFAAYWAAARLLLTGGNAYSAAQLLALQRTIGMAEADPLIMWNPPWALSFLWPFGLVDFTLGQFLWLLSHCLLVLFAAERLSALYCQSAHRLHAACVLAFTFLPCVYALVLGQITPLILASLVLFVVSVQRQRWLVAGAALALLAIKPHFIFLFWVALALWTWRERRWRPAAWAGLILTVASVLPLFFDEEIYRHYLAVFRSGDYLKPLELPGPTLRNVLKEFFGLTGWFFDYLPSAMGALWMVWHWCRHREDWQWEAQLPLILLVSLTTSVYGWTFDQTILIPALIQVYGWYEHKAPMLLAAFVAFNAVYLGLRHIEPLDFYYFWMAPAMLMGYCLARRKQGVAPS